MNTVSEILSYNIAYNWKIPLALKLKIKRLGRPIPNLDIIQPSTSKNKVFHRKFSTKYYEIYPWLCGCETRKAMFCFPCLLLGDKVDGKWTKTGNTALRHILKVASTHSQTSIHINNEMELALLGQVDIRRQGYLLKLASTHSQTTIRINDEMELALLGQVDIRRQFHSGFRANIKPKLETIDKNRYILSKIIDCIRLCSALEIAMPMPDHDKRNNLENTGSFRELIDVASTLNGAMIDHLQNSAAFQGTFETIHYDLLDAMLDVCRDFIVKEVESTQFLAILADETTDSFSQNQMVIILRYESCGEFVERFWGVFNTDATNANGLSRVILTELQNLGVDETPEKLIAQSYDVMSESNEHVRAKIMKVYRDATYVHSYAHQVKLVIEKCTLKNERVKRFFYRLGAFPAFFLRSPKRMAVLNRLTLKKQQSTPAQCSFQSDLVYTVSVYKHEIRQCLEEISETEYDSATISEALALLRFFDDEEFSYWLEFFHKVMLHVDVFVNKLQERNTEIEDINTNITGFNYAISKLLETYPEEVPRRRYKPKECHSKRDIAEVCNLITTQLEERFKSFNHIIASKLLYPEKFAAYSKSFLMSAFKGTLKAYPSLNNQKLGTELAVIYKRKDFCSADGLFRMLQVFLSNNLATAFSETVKLIRMLCTIPMITAENEKCFSTLKRAKRFLRNTVPQDRLCALGMLSIEKQLVDGLPDFNSLVIDKFARANDQCSHFLYQ